MRARPCAHAAHTKGVAMQATPVKEQENWKRISCAMNAGTVHSSLSFPPSLFHVCVDSIESPGKIAYPTFQLLKNVIKLSKNT